LKLQAEIGWRASSTSVRQAFSSIAFRSNLHLLPSEISLRKSPLEKSGGPKSHLA
jgi:hypothetical protein